LKQTTIDGQLLKEMLLSGAYELDNNKAMVNSLNVFPVPDGDTGTNMSATMASAASEINQVKNISLQSIGDALAMGSLMGARGNSGVILSQLLRGFSKQLKGKNSINTEDFAVALKEGVSTAYRAVMKPTEGTILTVARESAEAAEIIAKEETDVHIFLKRVIAAAEDTLSRTPDMLPVLKQAGVVDAGGKGLAIIYDGMLKRLESGVMTEKKEQPAAKEEVSPKTSYDNIDTSDIKFGYCTEFFIKTNNGDPDKFRDTIKTYGDSIAVVGMDTLIKVHIHTNNPGTVLNEAMKFGELSKIKIDNMREQHRSLSDGAVQEEPRQESENAQEKEYGLITVAMGEGISDIFNDLGVDTIIEGGQTMNPSTQDILDAVEKVNAKNIIILPNNGNIVMAAQQARDISKKNVYVVPTKSIPQGITAVISLNPELTPDENLEEMNSAIKNVKTGQVTYAVRDTVVNDVEIKEGNIIGMYNGKLVKSGPELDAVTRELLEEMMDEDSELVTILYGKDASEDSAQELADYLEEKYPDCEVSINYGGQPLYYYILSVE
jgi:DAK2 domain fusion protein YloV